MRILVVNPNTTAAMTDLIGRSARAVLDRPGVTVEAVNPATGPVSIESHYDEALAVPGLLAEVAAGERRGVAGYVIACFGDPGLDAARELAAGPVVGIAEAAMRTAAYLGRSFSVVTTLGRTRGRAWDLARAYGLERQCAGVHACELPVLALESDPDAAKTVLAACRDAVAADGSDAVVLGCAGMADLARWLTGELGVPVVDGVTAAVLTVHSLLALGLSTGALGEYARPPAKPYTGLLAPWAPRPPPV